MKKRIIRTFLTTTLATLFCVTLAIPAMASTNPFAAMEAKSRQAVEMAIKAGTVPTDTTIYDCEYNTDKNGVTIVIKYRDKNGNWIDVTTGVKANPPSAQTSPAAPPKALTEEELKAYADTVFDLINKEREKAGVSPLSRDSLLDEAAMVRAAEVKIVDDAGGKPHTRPNGKGFRTLLEDMGINGNRCAENLNRSKATPQAAMDSWMKSDGHREIILRERYGSVGIGVYQRPDGKLDWIQIFERK